MKRMTCPHCRGLGKIVVRTELPVYLPKLSADIYRRIKAAPNSLDGPALAELIYAHRADGGPDNPLNVIYVTIKRTNKFLAEAGEQIKASRRGPGATYSIVKI